MKENALQNEVIVTDIKLPLGTMITFMMKLAVAAIPAVMLLTIFVYMFSLFVFSRFHG
ncbi:MAG: hypothetical protein JSV11_10160 [Nitrospiraceae bacterium]|nr:MAG: hypothetical protein JSU99_06355 [Nitrospiraceae bacterium]UCH44648.1 MAG: hypothetical protein JSV11_10160 [Nitrospiraceae bacterium]